MSESRKPIEFWVTLDKTEKCYVQIPDLFAHQPLADKYEGLFRVKQVLPESSQSGVDFKIDRFTTLGHRRPDGPLCLYKDVVKLISENEALRSRCEKLEKALSEIGSVSTCGQFQLNGRITGPEAMRIAKEALKP